MNILRKFNKIKLLSIFIFIIIFFLNLLTIKVADDYGYSISNGIVDIISKEVVQYFTWNGRSVAHLIARFFLSMPKIVFDIANSLVFTYFLNLIYKFVTTDEDNYILFILITLSVFLFVPFFGQTILWETGSCNYLWMCTLVLQFLYFYRRNDKNINFILLFLLGICAGWSNENTGGACILIALIFTIKNYFENKLIKKELIFGLMGAIIGFLLLVLAPGNAVRALEFVNNNSHIYTIVHDFTSTIRVIKEGLLYLLITFAFLCFALFKQRINSLIISGIFMFAAIADIGAIILSPVPVLWDRSMFGAAIFAIIAVGILINELDLNVMINRYIINMLLSTMVIFSSIALAHTFFDIGYVFIQNYQRNSYIKYQKNNGNLDPIVFQFDSEFMTSYNATYGLNDITPYYSFWYNEDFAKVEGLNTIQSTNKTKWDLIYKNGDINLMSISNMKKYIDYLQDNNERYLVFINSSTLDQRYEDYYPLLEKMGIDTSYRNITAVIDEGNIISYNYGNEGCELYGNFNEKEYYVASYAAGNLSDIVIDGVEYTNNHSGINFVVFDKNEYRIVDSISFVLDYGMQGIRYEVE